MLKSKVSRASSWEEKTGVKKGSKDKMQSARMRGICKERPEPISMSHCLQDSSFEDEAVLQVNLMLFLRELNTHLARKWENLKEEIQGTQTLPDTKQVSQQVKLEHAWVVTAPQALCRSSNPKENGGSFTSIFQMSLLVHKPCREWNSGKQVLSICWLPGTLFTQWNPTALWTDCFCFTGEISKIPYITSMGLWMQPPPGLQSLPFSYTSSYRAAGALTQVLILALSIPQENAKKNWQLLKRTSLISPFSVATWIQSWWWALFLHCPFSVT